MGVVSRLSPLLGDLEIVHSVVDVETRHRDGLEAGYPVDIVLEPGDELQLIVRGANGALSDVLMLPNPQPGLVTMTLGESARLTLPTASLDGAFTPLAADALPENYRPQE